MRYSQSIYAALLSHPCAPSDGDPAENGSPATTGAPERTTRGQTLESIAYKLKIQTLKAQVALCQLICASLAREFEEESLTFVERSALAHRWDDTLKDGYVLQLTLDLLERQEREKNKQLNSTPQPPFCHQESDSYHLRSVQTRL